MNKGWFWPDCNSQPVVRCICLCFPEDGCCVFVSAKNKQTTEENNYKYT